MSRFVTLKTRPVPLGPCQCPGTPHPDGDVAQVYSAIGWDDLVDVGSAPTEGAGRRILVTRAIASWNLVELADVLDDDGNPTGEQVAKPVPVVEASVRLLGDATLTMLADAVNEAYEAARDPVPNGSGALSPDSSSESASPSQPTTPTPTTSS